jgi:hypothetical protein
MTSKEAAMAEAAKNKEAPVTPAVTEEAAEAVPPVEEQAPVTVSVKSAFAAALERKKQAGQARSAHLDGHGGVGGATSSHKATRTFRRKSGSA